MQEQDGESEPAHHARRPMNAFLIFCKRHRSVVRDKYPNLENRSITKILGEWWANLEKEEKACYTGLAKQYKDAFFNANPDFKWYKLPAPPLRTLAPRPRDPDEPPRAPPRAAPLAAPCAAPFADSDLEKTNNNSTKVDLNHKTAPRDPPPDRKPLSMFTPGKLADEAHMGGLSSLLATKTEPQTPNPYYSPPSCKMNAISTPNDLRCQTIFENAQTKVVANEESIRELQDALSETSKMFEDDDNDKFTNQDMIDQIVDKRYSKDDDKNWADDADKGRSCKGKRYQEFMAIGGLIVTKRQKRDYNDKMGEEEFATYGWEPGTSYSEDSAAADEGPSRPASAAPSPDRGLDPASRPYRPADFDLDAKIRALPSLSLDKFQQKKRESKRRKKSQARPRGEPPLASYPAVGSQKRKPRKVSITRLELGGLPAPEMKLATEAPAALAGGPRGALAPGGPRGALAAGPPPCDLLALATLAEVAAHTSRIEHHLFSDYAAKGNDDNASKV